MKMIRDQRNETEETADNDASSSVKLSPSTGMFSYYFCCTSHVTSARKKSYRYRERGVTAMIPKVFHRSSPIEPFC